MTNFIDCSSSLGSYNVTVDSPSYEYGSQGKFTCPKNNKLFDETGIERKDPLTICNEFAEWENSQGLQCWKGIKNYFVIKVFSLCLVYTIVCIMLSFKFNLRLHSSKYSSSIMYMCTAKWCKYIFMEVRSITTFLVFYFVFCW